MLPAGIYFAALLTTGLAIFIVGGILWRITPKSERWLILLCVGLQLPMCALAYYEFRLPFLQPFWLKMAGWLQPELADGAVAQSLLYRFLRMWDAPLSEEPAKLWPLLLPFLYRAINRQNCVRYALALGLGFGIGEMWFVAYVTLQPIAVTDLNQWQKVMSHVWLSGMFSATPHISQLAWYQLGGFISERLLVCLMHGAFTAAALSQLHKRLWLGFFMAMLLHFLGNFPIFFKLIGLGGFSALTWNVLLGIYLPLYFILMAAVLARLHYQTFAMGRFIFGEAICPECHQIYARPFFGVNRIRWRYERCQACRRFHWIGPQHEVKGETIKKESQTS